VVTLVTIFGVFHKIGKKVEREKKKNLIFFEPEIQMVRGVVDFGPLNDEQGGVAHVHTLTIKLVRACISVPKNRGFTLTNDIVSGCIG
jgi:hypothetical protein